MVSSNHEAMHHLFQDNPEVFARATRALGLPFPDPTSVELLPTDVTEIRPLERRLDTVLRVTTAEGAFVLPIEAQGRKDEDKETFWPYCVAYLHEKYGLPVVLLVVCQDKATQEWASGPFTTGFSDWTTQYTQPLVLGPDSVPAITDPAAAAEDIPLATLSANTHAKDKAVDDILKALAAALETIDRDTGEHFAVYTELGLGKTRAAALWRELMTSFYRSETFEHVRAEGEARILLRVLDHRNIAMSDAIRERIANCTDHAQLDRWADKAVDIETIDELFM